ncbi:hypothetical protein Nmel_000061 [Mimus melanotis]
MQLSPRYLKRGKRQISLAWKKAFT